MCNKKLGLSQTEIYGKKDNVDKHENQHMLFIAMIIIWSLAHIL